MHETILLHTLEPIRIKNFNNVEKILEIIKEYLNLTHIHFTNKPEELQNTHLHPKILPAQTQTKAQILHQGKPLHSK